MQISQHLRGQPVLIILSLAFVLSLAGPGLGGGGGKPKPPLIGTGKCVYDTSSTSNACQSPDQEECPSPAGPNDTYCNNAQSPGTCDESDADQCELNQNVSCGGQCYCMNNQPLTDADGNEIRCTGAPDSCPN